MQGGSFADCKVFVINAAKGTENYAFEQGLIQYLSLREVQLQALIECDSIPSCKDAIYDIYKYRDEMKESTYLMAMAQNQMVEYGRPQPFNTGVLNTYYYSKGAPDIYRNYVAGYDDYSSREVMYQMQYIWMKGSAAKSIPSVLPADIE